MVVITTVGFGVITQPVMQGFINQAANKPGPGGGLTPAPSLHAAPAGHRIPAFNLHVTAQAHGARAESDLRAPLLLPSAPLSAAKVTPAAPPSAAAAAGGGGADALAAPPMVADMSAVEGMWQQANDMLWRGEVPGLATGVPVYTPPPPPAAAAALTPPPPPPVAQPRAEAYGGSSAAGSGCAGAGVGAGAGAFAAAQLQAGGVGTPRGGEGAPHSAVLLPQGPRGVVGLGGVCAGGLTTAEAVAAAEGDEEAGSTWLHRQWRRFDARWLQPLLGGSRTDGAV